MTPWSNRPDSHDAGALAAQGEGRSRPGAPPRCALARVSCAAWLETVYAAGSRAWEAMRQIPSWWGLVLGTSCKPLVCSANDCNLALLGWRKPACAWVSLTDAFGVLLPDVNGVEQ